MINLINLINSYALIENGSNTVTSVTLKKTEIMNECSALGIKGTPGQIEKNRISAIMKDAKGWIKKNGLSTSYGKQRGWVRAEKVLFDESEDVFS